MEGAHTHSNNGSGSGYVMLPVAARDFLLQVVQDASHQLSKTNRLRATTHILLEGGVKLTKSNSFTIDHRDQLLLMSLAARLLAKTEGGEPAAE
jgi:hypothetical protein